ncbi:MAG: PAS domain S-box protein [Candidatus Nanoarchaeia archaeon]
MKSKKFGVEDLPVPVFEISSKGDIIYANKAARQKFGYTAKEVEGKSMYYFVDQSEHDKLRKSFSALNKKVTSNSNEYTGVKKNGKRFPVIIHSKRKLREDESSVIGTIFDLTLQKKTENKLDKTKKKYIDLFENSAEGLYQTGKKGKLLNINKSFAKILGYKSKEEMLENVTNVTDIYVDKKKRKKYKQLMNEYGNVRDLESQVYKKDGKIIWIHEDANEVLGNDGEFKYYTGNVIDITAKKEFEEELKKANERTASLNKFILSIFDGISDEIIVIDAKSHKILYANNKVLERTGLSINEIKNKKCYEIYHYKKERCQTCKTSSIKDSIEYEQKLYDKSGEVIYINIAYHPIFDENGNVERLVLIAKNITDYKKYENRLKELNEKLLNLYQTSTSLQKAHSIKKIYDIANETFEKLGFERVRIYSYKDNYLHGEKSNYLDNQEFKKLYFPIEKHHKKAYECITQKKPVISTDRGKVSIASFLKKPSDLLSGSLPLISENKVVGMISFDNYYSRKPLLEKDLEILMTFANQIASSIERARIQQENINQLNKLSTLYDISSSISQTLDLQKILNMVAIRLVKLLKVDRCLIFLIDEEKEKIVNEAFFDKKENSPRMGRFSIEKSITGRALNENRIICIEDTMSNKKYKKYCDVLPDDFRSFISIPLVIENITIGVINIYTRKKKHFTADEVDLVKALASHSSMMIENSRLYERIKHDKDNFSALLNITRETGKLHDLDSLIDNMLKHTIVLTGADYGFVLLKENNHLNLTASEGKYTKKQLSLKVGKGIAGMVAKTGKTIVVGDCDKEERYIQTEKDIKSCASIPLFKKGTVMGVLQLESKRKNNFKFFDKSLKVLTNHLSVSIENLRLYEKVLNFNKELEKKVNEATKELREKNKELRKMDQMKSDFVSNVSHELRTPLTSISGYTKLLNMGKLGEINEQQKNVISIIIKESDRLTKLINEVLDLSKLESGKIGVKFEKVDFKEVIEETVLNLGSMAEDKDIKIKTKIHQKTNTINANRDLLKQVITNLLSNAIKFTPKKGIITIEAKKNNDKIKLIVTDTGRGIKKEHIHKLFDKFYQVDSSMTKEEGGTGLGLVIVKHIVDLHKGKIDVNSKVGKGSTFTVTLPLKQENEAGNFIDNHS